MKTGKKIAVGLAAALMVAIFAAGAVSMVGAAPLSPYVVTVFEGVPDVTIAVGTGGVDFELLQKGESSTLSNSLVLTNTGTATAKVEVKLIPDVGGVHGLVNVVPPLSRVIPASNLRLGTTGNEVPLLDTGVPKDLGNLNYVPAGGDDVNYNAELSIPGDQPADNYGGLIELIISAA